MTRCQLATDSFMKRKFILLSNNAPLLCGAIERCPCLLYVLWLVLITCGICFSVTAQSESDGKSARLSGVVVDAKQVPIYQALVTLEKLGGSGKGVIKTTVTDQEGGFRFILQPGWYKINVNRSAFHDSFRPPFELLPNASLNLTFTLIPKIIMDTEGRNLEKPDLSNTGYLTHTLLSGRKKDLCELTVFFGRAKKVDDQIEYEGFIWTDFSTKIRQTVSMPTVANFNRLTVTADQIRINEKQLSIEAKGNVIVDDGHTRRRKNRASVALIGCQWVLHLD